MFGMFPLRPAFGRDYKSKKEIVAALDANKDFECANGSYIGKKELLKLGIKYAEIRYNKNRSCCTVTLKP